MPLLSFAVSVGLSYTEINNIQQNTVFSNRRFILHIQLYTVSVGLSYTEINNKQLTVYGFSRFILHIDK